MKGDNGGRKTLKSKALSPTAHTLWMLQAFRKVKPQVLSLSKPGALSIYLLSFGFSTDTEANIQCADRCIPCGFGLMGRKKYDS